MKVSLTDRSDSKSIVLYSTILLIATGMLMTGCRKEDYAHGAKGCQENCIQILGKVVNPNNPEDLTIARVEAWYHNGAFIYFPLKVGETMTGNDGSFKLEIDGSDFYQTQGYLEFIVYRDGYLTSPYDGREVVDYKEFVGIQDPVGVIIESRKSARIRFHLQNLTGKDYNDLRYRYTYVNAWYSFWPDHYPPGAIGSIHETAGEQFTQIQFSYKSDGIETVKHDSLYIGAGELGLYTMVID